MELHYLAKSPFQQFHDWFKEAEARSGQEFPNAMNLATAGPDGRPSSRMVLLKGLTEQGLAFFTNLESRKGQELAANPYGALCFYWDKLHRQVRVEGEVERLGQEESAAYFHSRPRGSQLGAWASQQSTVIPSRAYLEEKMREAEERFAAQPEIPLPPFWGGFLLKPTRFEFWQQCEFRLHDRFVYTPAPNGAWKVERLSP